MTKEWIYRLAKSELASELEVLGLAADGTIDELRRRLSQYVSDHPESFRAARPEITIAPGANATDASEVQARAVNQIRKWGCHFDDKDPTAFFERLEELKGSYQISGTQLLYVLPELLRGDALLWYRNSRQEWRTWEQFVEDFRDYFIPPRYQAQLRRDVRARMQGAEEPYRRYATEMLTMMRRATGYTEEERIDILYEQMHPRYKFYLPRSGIQRVGDILRRAEEIEQLEGQLKTRGGRDAPASGNTTATVTAGPYDRNECCWRCKQRGHTRFDCRRIPRRFCSQCGKDGVFTRDCHPPPGNARQNGETGADLRS